MLDTQPTFGSIESTDEAKRAYAAASLQENGKVALFRKLFPNLAKLADDPSQPQQQQQPRPMSVSTPPRAPTVAPHGAPVLLRRQETEVEPTPQAVDEEPAVAAPAPTQGPDYMLWFFVAGGAAALAAFLWVMSME